MDSADGQVQIVGQGGKSDQSQEAHIHFVGPEGYKWHV